MLTGASCFSGSVLGGGMLVARPSCRVIAGLLSSASDKPGNGDVIGGGVRSGASGP